ncbi:hypothetical protein B0T11DRAFT_114747 [Plectosphaerella cucumerina]|uniref:Uncharacterized protein n=1 Tax=Plectosphaerella cucumerina TaxID=40658 RepID=A0A8K0TD01_9PEZI|nr:hypothetical protein B0T11DRAFT_114747 [Plectosphaerella cucumerina]
MERVLCQCAACDAKVGLYTNLWLQIGKGYYSPVLDDEAEAAHVVKGSQRDGEEGTLVAECVLQDIACSQCDANIGLKCVSSPVNHVLPSNRVLFRQAAVRVLSRHRGRKPVETQFKVQRVLKIKEASTPAAAGPPAPVFTPTSHVEPFESSSAPEIFERMQAELDLQRGDLDRIDTAAFSVVSSFNTSVTRIDMELEKLGDTMRSLRRELEANRNDISPIKSTLDELEARSNDKTVVRGLEEQMEIADAALAAVRQLAQEAHIRENELQSELQSTKKDVRLLQEEAVVLSREVATAKQAAEKSATAAATHAQDMAVLRSEMRQMRETLRKQERHVDNAPSHSADEVQILSSNISKLASRMSDFSNLQMHLDLFSLRLQRLEGRPVEQSKRPADDLDAVPGSSPTSRKRPARAVEPDPVLETPSRSIVVDDIEDTVHVAANSPRQRRPSTARQQAKHPLSSGSKASRVANTGTPGRRGVRRTLPAASYDHIYTPPDD